jgi:acetyl-CoA carboxylase biotin carboxyl carrier protein
VSIDFHELRELLGTISQTDITELTLKSDDFELTIRKGTMVTSERVAVTTPVVEIPTTPTPISKTAIVATPSTETSSAPPTMVGTFYRAPAPDEPSFVSVGDRITKGQVVCIIEAMKLMNDIEAEFSGQVMEVLVQNGEPIEYGQALMLVNPQ